MEVNYPLFSFERCPQLLPELRNGAQKGLEKEPKSFGQLNSLMKFMRIGECDFDHYYPQAIQIFKRETFQHRPGAFNRLFPLAKNYIEILKPESLGQQDGVDLKKYLSKFREVHQAFQERFVEECLNATPDEPFAILNKYPKTLRLYYTAFVGQLSEISSKRLKQWKECVERRGEELIEVFPRLAIHHLIKNPSASIPEFFSEYEKLIEQFRGVYKTLKDEEKKALLLKLYGDDSAKVPPLFISISNLCSDLRKKGKINNGIIRIIYEEIGKAFTILDQIHLERGNPHAEFELRVAILGLLKQENLTHDLLPRNFADKKLEDKMLIAHKKYQELSLDAREKFDHLFLDPNEDPDEFYDLIQDWREIYYLWWSFPQIFPLSLLSKAALHYNKF